MALNWMNIEPLSFNCMLLLEKVQIKWLFDFIDKKDLGIALKANPLVAWYFENKCPEVIDQIRNLPEPKDVSNTEARKTELSIMGKAEDWFVYALNPEIYDKMRFLEWDPKELTALTNYDNKIILDIGSGTGKLAFTVKNSANTVYCIEPIGNLRDYIKAKIRQNGNKSMYVVDGLITDIPFHDSFADVTMAGHVFGDELENEYEEMMRVTKNGGMIILCPGNNDSDNKEHKFLVEKGFEWSVFEEPTDGMKRKYWKKKEIE